MNNTQINKPFSIKDCALVAIATGNKAQNLRELHATIQTIDQGSIYYHFWGGLLRPRFDDPEYNNDFAAWAMHALNDLVLAERLSVIDPTDFRDTESLRQELLEVIEDRLDEIHLIPWSKTDEQFYFIKSQIVVFDIFHELKEPRELALVLPNLSVGSVFYHFIDARRRTPDNLNDFSAWLSGFGNKYKKLCKELCAVDPYFATLTELRQQLDSIFTRYFKGTKR